MKLEAALTILADHASYSPRAVTRAAHSALKKARKHAALRGCGGQTLVHVACLAGNTRLAIWALECAGPRLLELCDDRGRTALLCALAGGHYGLARLLVTVHKVDVSCKTADGRSALHLACSAGEGEFRSAAQTSAGHRLYPLVQFLSQPAAVSYLYSACVNVYPARYFERANSNEPDPEVRALFSLAHQPAWEPSLFRDTVRAMLARGLDVDARLPTGETALVECVRAGQTTRAQALLELGADLALDDHRALQEALGACPIATIQWVMSRVDFASLTLRNFRALSKAASKRGDLQVLQLFEQMAVERERSLRLSFAALPKRAKRRVLQMSSFRGVCSLRLVCKELARAGASVLAKRGYLMRPFSLTLAHEESHVEGMNVWRTRDGDPFGCRVCNVVVCGSSRSGKTELLSCIVNGPTLMEKRFRGEASESIKITRCFHGEAVRVEMWEASKRRSVVGVHAVVACYDIASVASWKSLPAALKEAQGDSDVPVVVVGTKADLEVKREVAASNVDAYCEAQGFEHVQVSSLMGWNVQLCVKAVLDRVLRRVESAPATAYARDIKSSGCAVM
eukprot:m51a1_g1419 hypothetical protein (569) ;mRNA; f:52396-54796